MTDTTEQDVERVAKAIWDSDLHETDWESRHEAVKDDYRFQARAAIAVMQPSVEVAATPPDRDDAWNAKGNQADFDEGYRLSSGVPDCADQSTILETIQNGGPDFRKPEWCTRPKMYHYGYDAAIWDARALTKGDTDATD